MCENAQRNEQSNFYPGISHASSSSLWNLKLLYFDFVGKLDTHYCLSLLLQQLTMASWVVGMMHSSKLFGLAKKVHKCPWCMNDCLPWDNVHHVTCTIAWLYGLDNTWGWGDSSDHFSTNSIPAFRKYLNWPSALLQGLKMAAFLYKCTIALHYSHIFSCIGQNFQAF